MPWFGSTQMRLPHGPTQLPESCGRCCCRCPAESAMAAGEEEGWQPGRGRAESPLGGCTAGVSGMTHGVGKWCCAALLYPKGSPRPAALSLLSPPPDAWMLDTNFSPVPKSGLNLASPGAWICPPELESTNPSPLQSTTLPGTRGEGFPLPLWLQAQPHKHIPDRQPQGRAPQK